MRRPCIVLAEPPVLSVNQAQTSTAPGCLCEGIFGMNTSLWMKTIPEYSNGEGDGFPFPTFLTNNLTAPSRSYFLASPWAFFPPNLFFTASIAVGYVTQHRFLTMLIRGIERGDGERNRGGIPCGSPSPASNHDGARVDPFRREPPRIPLGGEDDRVRGAMRPVGWGDTGT